MTSVTRRRCRASTLGRSDQLFDHLHELIEIERLAQEPLCPEAGRVVASLIEDVQAGGDDDDGDIVSGYIMTEAFEQVPHGLCAVHQIDDLTSDGWSAVICSNVCGTKFVVVTL